MDKIKNFFVKEGKVMKFRVFVATILVLGIIAGISNSGESDKGTGQSSDEVEVEYALPYKYRAIEEAYTGKTFQSVSATKLSKDYQSNKVSADEKYKGKVVKITGTVDKVDEMFSTFIDYSTGRFSLFSVHCTIDDDYKKDVSKLRKGVKHTSYGIVESGGAIVELDPCLPVKTIKDATKKLKSAAKSNQDK